MFGSSSSSVVSFSGSLSGERMLDSPAISPCQSHQSSVSVDAVEHPDQEFCPIRILASQIDSCAKARVIALLAMEFLVFDGKLHGDRSNWACPFGDCKENFPHAKALMRHVAGCSLSSGAKVYCNSCRKYDCFTLQGRNDQFCSASDDAVRAGPCSPKKSKGLRKLTNLFLRGRSASASSSLGTRHTIIPSAASSRRASSLGNPPSPGPQELGSGPLHEMGDSTSGGVPDVAIDVIPELPTTPEPFIAGRLSPVSMTNISPMFSEGFTESPVEDVNGGSWYISSENEPASLQTISPNQVHSPWSTSSPSAYSHFDRGAGQASWSMVQQSSPQYPYVSASFPTNPYTSTNMYRQASWPLYGSTASSENAVWDGTSFAHQKQRSSTWPQQPTSMAGQSGPRKLHQVPNGCVVSWPGNASTSRMEPDHSEAPPPSSRRGGESSQIPMSGLIPEASPSLSSLPDKADPDRCPHSGCSFRSRGNPAKRAVYLKKHLATHLPQKVTCSGCGKEFSRLDNLKTHQKKVCPRRRLSVHDRQSRTPSHRAARRLRP
ncbi:hypothetical protein J3459_010642 [Metarhizium acridum]|nr:hypothetical protein J3459_010642 [Metarhizium acridum]